MQTSLKLNICSRLFIAFLKSSLNLEYFEKKISLIALVLQNLLTAKQLATKMSKRPSFMQHFGRQHVNRSQTLRRSTRSQFHTTPPLISDRGSRKMLVLVRSEILEMFVNTLTADYKYSR